MNLGVIGGLQACLVYCVLCFFGVTGGRFSAQLAVILALTLALARSSRLLGQSLVMGWLLAWTSEQDFGWGQYFIYLAPQDRAVMHGLYARTGREVVLFN